MQITELTNANGEALNAINTLLLHLSAHASSLTMEQLETIAHCESTHLYLATEGEEIIGMFTLCTTLHPTGITIWLEDLVLSPDYHGHGLGRQLAEAAAKEAHALLKPQASKRSLRPHLMLTSRPERKAANRIYSALFGRKQTNVYQLPLSTFD